MPSRFAAAFIAGLVIASFCIPAGAAEKTRKQAAPRGWPTDGKKVMDSKTGLAKMKSSKKPGLAYVYPPTLATNDSAGNREASAFKSFVSKLPNDKALYKKMGDDFVCFATPSNRATSQMKCENFGIVLLDSNGMKAWVWEMPPNSTNEFKGYLFNAEVIFEKAAELRKKERAAEDEERKKEVAAAKEAEEEKKDLANIPGLGGDSKTPEKKPKKKPKKEAFEEEDE